jgi:hypothetical protein
MRHHLEDHRVGYMDGIPIAMTPNHDDDCLRWDWWAKINGAWHEIDTAAITFHATEAKENIQRILLKS